MSRNRTGFQSCMCFNFSKKTHQVHCMPLLCPIEYTVKYVLETAIGASEQHYDEVLPCLLYTLRSWNQHCAITVMTRPLWWRRNIFSLTFSLMASLFHHCIALLKDFQWFSVLHKDLEPVSKKIESKNQMLNNACIKQVLKSERCSTFEHCSTFGFFNTMLFNVQYLDFSGNRTQVQDCGLGRSLFGLYFVLPGLARSLP